MCARFAIERGPRESLRRPRLPEFGEPYQGAIYLGPRIIALDSPHGHYLKSRCPNFLIWTRSWRTLSFAVIWPSLFCHRQSNWALIDETWFSGRGAALRQSRTRRPPNSDASFLDDWIERPLGLTRGSSRWSRRTCSRMFPSALARSISSTDGTCRLDRRSPRFYHEMRCCSPFRGSPTRNLDCWFSL